MSEYVFHCHVEYCPVEDALPTEQKHHLTPAAVLHAPDEVSRWLESFVVSLYGSETGDEAGDMGYWREEWLRQAEVGGQEIVLNLHGPHTVTVLPMVHPVHNMHWHIYQEEVHFSRIWSQEERRRQVATLRIDHPGVAADYLGKVAALFLDVEQEEYFRTNHEEISFWENQLVTMRRVFSFSQGPDFHITIETFDGTDCHLCVDS
ncbi:hypothetical protein ACQPW3_25030 [Actinosynnema sp. CA-248983]